MSTTVRQMLAETVVSKEIIDRFLDPGAHNWAQFDAELGYRPHRSTVKDGYQGAYSIYNYAPTGERRMLHYADLPCRINTYGNSFTQCHQVSDGETWQEYLAAHLGEPIRNYGVGGYGVYQAYRRMLREELVNPAEYIVLNVWSDDHWRSIYPWRWIHIPFFRRDQRLAMPTDAEACMYHANPWAHLRLDPDSGQFEECGNLFPTPQSLYELTDADRINDAFGGCFGVQAYAATQGATDIDRAMLSRHADALGVAVDWSDADATAESGRRLLAVCALLSSEYVLEKTRAFCEAHGKKLMVMLSYASPDVVAACHGRPRFDQSFVDYLVRNDYLVVDSLAAHVDDYRAFSLTPEEYAERLYIGHYNPSGNHWFAFAVRSAVVEWLDPKPPTYRREGPAIQSLAATLA